MTILIKTIQTIGQATVFFQNSIFVEPAFSPVYEGVPFALFGTLRRGVSIAVVVSVFMAMLTTVFLIHSIVANEYALKRVSVDIRTEEELLSAVLVGHAGLVSSDAIIRAMEVNPHANLVSVETIKYIRSNSILQANALLK